MRADSMSLRTQPFKRRPKTTKLQRASAAQRSDVDLERPGFWKPICGNSRSQAS